MLLLLRTGVNYERKGVKISEQKILMRLTHLLIYFIIEMLLRPRLS